MVISPIEDQDPFTSNVTDKPLRYPQINKTFELFKNFAKNPLEELYGRSLYSCEKTKGKVYVLGSKEVIRTFCGDTYRGLLKALFDSKKLAEISNDTAQFETVVRENGKALLAKPDSQFFAYGLQFGTANFFLDMIFGGHALIVIQYLDSEKTMRYKFFQSYAMAYSLLEYIEKGENDLDESQFALFLQSLQKFISSTQWTQDMADFHQKYFATKDRCPANGKMATTIPLTVQWGESSAQEVMKHSNLYETLKKSDDFPKFILLGEKNNKGQPRYGKDEEEQIVNEVYRSRVSVGPRCLFVTPAITVDQTVDDAALQKLLNFYKKPHYQVDERPKKRTCGNSS